MTDDIHDFDLNAIDDGFIADPHPVLHALRRAAPVHRNPDGSVFLTRYEDCLRVYRSREMSSDKTKAFGEKFGKCPLYTHHTTSLVFNDPPNHTVVRKLIAAAFTPRKLAEFEPLIAQIVDRLLDDLADYDSCDLVQTFASALPTEIISVMLGIPEAHRAKLRGYSIDILGALDPVISDARFEAGNTAVDEFAGLLTDLIGYRRAHPDAAGQGEVLDALIFGDHEGRRLSDVELVQNCIFLLNAGHETTTSMVSNMVGQLLEHPGAMAQLRRDPELIGTAVEESLRYDSPLQIGNRLATTDIDLGHTVIREGTYIHTSIAGANRDPDRFDDPDGFDITRKPNPQIAFITGIHVCLGATLARTEARLAVGGLVRRFPHLAPDGPAKRLPLARFRGYHSLPVRLT